MTDNSAIGQLLYAQGDTECRDWFHRQWKIWPQRADPKLTTNGSLHYGGVRAFRIENDADPEMSKEFSEHVGVMDRLNARRDAP